MARITMRQLLDHAAEHGYGVPAFNINNMEQALAIGEACNALDAPVKVAEEISRKKTGGAPKVEAMVLFDRYTSYRVMTEVMFTLGQAKVGKFHFVAMSGKK